MSQCFPEQGGCAAFTSWPGPHPLHNLQTNASLESAHTDFHCLGATQLAGKPHTEVWKRKKKKTTPARSFQGICQAGRISGTPKMLLSPPNLNTCDPQDLLVGFVVEEHFLTEHSAQLSTKPNLKATRSWGCSSAKGLSGAQIRPSGKGEIITRGSSQGSKRAPLLTHQGGSQPVFSILLSKEKSKPPFPYTTGSTGSPKTQCEPMLWGLEVSHVLEKHPFCLTITKTKLHLSKGSCQAWYQCRSSLR